MDFMFWCHILHLSNLIFPELIIVVLVYFFCLLTFVSDESTTFTMYLPFPAIFLLSYVLLWLISAIYFQLKEIPTKASLVVINSLALASLENDLSLTSQY